MYLKSKHLLSKLASFSNTILQMNAKVNTVEIKLSVMSVLLLGLAKL